MGIVAVNSRLYYEKSTLFYPVLIQFDLCREWEGDPIIHVPQNRVIIIDYEKHHYMPQMNREYILC